MSWRYYCKSFLFCLSFILLSCCTPDIVADCCVIAAVAAAVLLMLRVIAATAANAAASAAITCRCRIAAVAVTALSCKPRCVNLPLPPPLDSMNGNFPNPPILRLLQRLPLHHRCCTAVAPKSAAILLLCSCHAASANCAVLQPAAAHAAAANTAAASASAAIAHQPTPEHLIVV